MLHATLGKINFPVAIGKLTHLIRCALGPVVEISHNKNLGGIRGPLAQGPTLVAVVKPVVVIGIGKVDQRAILASEFFLLIKEIVVSPHNGFFKGFKPWVILD